MLYTVFMRTKQPTRRRGGSCALLALLPFLLLVGPARAQTKPPAPALLTLARALASLPPPTQGILLAVGADKVTLPVGTEGPHGDGADLGALAAAFGEEAQAFGVVTAVAPASRIVLNEDPTPPDMSADLPYLIAFRMLAASLDDGQWAALTSERGLGLADLTDRTQQTLFHALFRRGRLWVASQDPEMAKLPDDQRTDTRDVSDQIGGVRIRLGQTAHLYVHDRTGKTIYFSTKPTDAMGRLHTWYPQLDSPAAQHNVVLRATVTNTPRPGDLHLDDRAFEALVPLAGLRTVDGLVARIAALTHKEIYTDPHYAHRTLTLIGPTPSASAGDLLGALALAVAGTYRQVGPAFVLTDDQAGVGVRRQRLADWEDAAVADSSKLGDQAGEALLQRRVKQASTLPTFGDSAALTPDQMKAIKRDAVFPGLPGEDENYPFAKLTAAQQDLARRTAQAYEEQSVRGTLPSYLAEDSPQEPDPTGPVDLKPEYKIQIIVPTVDTPVDTNYPFPIGTLFWPGEALFYAGHQPEAAQTPIPAKLPAPPLMPLLRSRPRRAVIGHPHTAASVDALVAAMQKVGLNELWLDVFSGGISHVGGKDPDILTEALKQTAGTGIAVYADLSLLPWGDTPPESACDLSIEGETSKEIAVHAHDRAQRADYDDAGKPVVFVPPPVLVSPAAEAVRGSLTTLVQGLSARPGLAGFIWEDAEAGDGLGYTPAMRLAFLRFAHADPLDITPQLSLKGDVSLPIFDDAAADKALPALWDRARAGANAVLLGGMRQALTPPMSARPILMEQSTDSAAWLASWDDPRQLPPPLRPLFAGVPYPKPEQTATVAAKQGRIVLLRAQVQNSADTDALARALQADLGGKMAGGRSAWGGFVLDFADEEATRGDHPLAGLVDTAAREAKAR